MKIHSPDQPVGNTGVISLIYGPPGIGKTTFGMSAHNSLLYDFDDGIKRTNANHRSNRVPASELTDWNEIISFAQSDEASKFDNHVYDTLGQFIEYLAEYIMANNPKMRTAQGMPTMNGWGAIKAEFKRFMMLMKQKGINLTFVGHEVEQKDDKDRTYIRPAASGSSIHEVLNNCDLVGRMMVFNKKRIITFDPTENFWAKNSAELPEEIEIPDLNKDPERLPLNEIFESVSQNRQQEVELSKKYNEILEYFKPKIDGISSKEDGNEVIEEIKNTEHVMSSRAALSQRLKNKADEIGAKLTKNGFE